MATAVPPTETSARFPTISNVWLSGTPSRVKSSTLHVPRCSSKSNAIGPSSDLDSVIASPRSGWNMNVIVARTSTSRRSAPEPGTLLSSNGDAGPISLFSTEPLIVPGNSRPWIPSQCTQRWRRAPPTSRASPSGWAPVSFAYVRTNTAATARAPAAFTASSGVTWSGAAGPLGPDGDALHAAAASATTSKVGARRCRIEGSESTPASPEVCSRGRSRPGGCGGSSDRSRKVRTPKGRVLRRLRRGRPREGATENRPPRAASRAR